MGGQCARLHDEDVHTLSGILLAHQWASNLGYCVVICDRWRSAD
jgi:hypothetical protein